MKKGPLLQGKPNKEQDLAWHKNILLSGQKDLSSDQIIGKCYRVLICQNSG